MHFGHPYFNTATVAGVLRMMLKDIAKELDVEFPIKDETQNPEQPWWVKHFSISREHPSNFNYWGVFMYFPRGFKILHRSNEKLTSSF